MDYVTHCNCWNHPHACAVCVKTIDTYVFEKKDRCSTSSGHKKVPRSVSGQRCLDRPDSYYATFPVIQSMVQEHEMLADSTFFALAIECSVSVQAEKCCSNGDGTPTLCTAAVIKKIMFRLRSMSIL